MKRALAVGVLIVLAGCAAQGGLIPSAEGVSVSAGGADATFVVASYNDVTFHDVVVVGYAANGSELCRASFGTVSEEQSRDVSCDAVPSLLVPNATEYSASQFGRGVSEVSHRIRVYHGVRDGEHRYADLVSWRGAPPREGELRAMPPSTALQRRAKCSQWANGGNMSALGPKPWLNWTYAEPATNRTYAVGVFGESHVEDPAHVYDSASLPPRIVELIDRARAGDGSVSEVAVARATYLDGVGAVAEREIDSVADAKLVADGLRGQVDAERWDRQVNCRRWPPEYAGSSEHQLRVHVRHGGEVWRVHLTVETERSGVAVAEFTDD